MKYLLIAFLCLPALALGCEYGDDPRLSNAQMPALVEAIANEETIPPIPVRISTYLQMGERSLALLEPHLKIHDVTCSPVAFFEGELLSQATIPFEEFYRLMATAIHEDRPGLAKHLFSKVRAASKTVAEIQQLFSQLPFEGAYGVSTRDRMTSIFPMYQDFPPRAEDLEDPLRDGRLKDYTMIKLFRVFGGEILFDRGCGPYELDQRFYKSKKVKTLFGEKTAVVARQEPFIHLMRTMGHQVSRDGRTTFFINNCNN
ncbi:hypothetical protein KG088_17735 [Halomonas sp. TRM85114]|uniref:hypothetical protein n=1 Tax=Halomonas jincaotanensis TaxID=2810616 RepID=UPI001BD5422A|nr:hypothetical protein [Halomonas jincaotanensis]MBS9405449.1 hypothetical protein [Halomonas jincaotanensis]